MCLKPAPPRPIPEATIALARMHFAEDSVYQFIGDVLVDQFHNEMVTAFIVGVGV